MSADAVSSLGAGGTNMRDYPLYLKVTSGTPIEYDAEDFRQYALQYERPGVMRAPHFKVTQNGSGDTKVSIASGIGIIQGTNDATNQGQYFIRSSAAVLLTLPAAPGSGTRAYRIVAQVRDGAETGTDYDWVFDYVEGPDTVGTFPAEPANAITLAKVTRSAGVATVLNAVITDYRFRAKLSNVNTTIGTSEWTASSSVNTVSGTDVLLPSLQVSGLNLEDGRKYRASFLVHYTSGNVAPTDTERGLYKVKVGSAGSAFDTAKGQIGGQQYVSAGGTPFGDSAYVSVVWTQSGTAYNQFVSVTVNRQAGDNTWVTTGGNGSHLEVVEL